MSKNEVMLNQAIVVAGRTIANRVVFQPMEGCDCNLDGTPSEATLRKYRRFAESGAGIIWVEATAVCKEGRTNLRQMMLTEENKASFAEFVKNVKSICKGLYGYEPLLFLQLTHSGRQSIVPMIAYRNSVYEAIRPMTDENIVSDEYLDTLPAFYAQSAKLAEEVGFDGVDVKSCHGYLFQEMLSAYNRQGKYGGSFENRSRLFLDSVKTVKSAVSKEFLVVSRFDVCDMVPKPNGFGTDEQNNVDLTEAKKLVGLLVQAGVEMLNITIGNPYYNPYVNRPCRMNADGTKPPEAAEVGLERFQAIEKEMKQAFPDLPMVSSGMSYYRKELIEKSEELLQTGVCDFVGYGRLTLAYPQFYQDYLAGNFDFKKCCVACSKCTALMRMKEIAGCAVYDEYYKNLYVKRTKGE